MWRCFNNFFLKYFLYPGVPSKPEFCHIANQTAAAIRKPNQTTMTSHFHLFSGFLLPESPRTSTSITICFGDTLTENNCKLLVNLFITNPILPKINNLN